ncbi:MAG: ABC transporter permease [Verrucomicrobiota bacterium]
MPWFLYLAFKQLFPTGRRFPFFTFMSGLGVAVGVALLVVATSIMGGFGQGIRAMIVDTQGEIQVMGIDGMIEDSVAAVAAVEKFPGVAGASPYAKGVVLMRYQNRPAYPGIIGVDLARVEKVIPLDRYMVQGRLEDLDDDSIILSVKLAGKIGARVGSEIEVVSPLAIEKFKQDEVMLPRVLRVAGIFQIGHQHLDSDLAIAPLRLMQELYGLGKTVHGLNVRLKPGVDEFKTSAAMNSGLFATGGLRAMTWFESEAGFQSIIRFEKYMIFFLLTFIVMVAALSIMSSLLISVVRKTREIGLLGALGGSSRQVAACFCAQGFILGVVGTGGGLALAWLVLTFRNDIVRVLAKLTVGPEVFEQFYGFVNLPSHTTTDDLVLIIIGAIVASTLAGLVPAWRAAKLKPVEALRSE